VKLSGFIYPINSVRNPQQNQRMASSTIFLITAKKVMGALGQ